RLWKDRWWIWKGSYYTEWADNDVKDEIRATIKRAFDAAAQQIPGFTTHVTTDRVNNVLGSLRTLVKVPSEAEQPVWIGDQDHPPADEFISLKNGLLHVPSYLKGETDCLRPHTPAFFNLNALDFDFDPEADEPAGWLKFLETIWGDDQESIDLLQEWAGY